MDTLTIQDNSAQIRPLEENETIYPQNDFECQVVTDLEFSAKGAEILILYEADLLELTRCTTQTYGITADTSTPGVIKLTASQSISRGEVYLCYLSFTAKADNIGKAYLFIYLCLNFMPLYQRYTGSTRPGHVLLRTAPAGSG